jgi:hypothetical protein
LRARFGTAGYFESDIIPRLVQEAVCELALVLLQDGVLDRFLDSGLEQFEQANVGPLSIVIDKTYSAGQLPDDGQPDAEQVPLRRGRHGAPGAGVIKALATLFAFAVDRQRPWGRSQPAGNREQGPEGGPADEGSASSVESSPPAEPPMSRRRNAGKRAFGQSKHRKARVLRFSHRNPDSRLAWGGPKKKGS